MTTIRGFGRMWRWAATILGGGSAFVLSGCDPTIRDTLLAGFQSASSSIVTTLIDALFIRIQQDDTTTTTMLDIAHDVVRMLA